MNEPDIVTRWYFIVTTMEALKRVVLRSATTCEYLICCLHCFMFNLIFLSYTIFFHIHKYVIIHNWNLQHSLERTFIHIV